MDLLAGETVKGFISFAAGDVGGTAVSAGRESDETVP
jgi:hypothetical protein